MGGEDSGGLGLALSNSQFRSSSELRTLSGAGPVVTLSALWETLDYTVEHPTGPPRHSQRVVTTARVAAGRGQARLSMPGQLLS